MSPHETVHVDCHRGRLHLLQPILFSLRLCFWLPLTDGCHYLWRRTNTQKSVQGYRIDIVSEHFYRVFLPVSFANRHYDALPRPCSNDKAPFQAKRKPHEVLHDFQLPGQFFRGNSIHFYRKHPKQQLIHRVCNYICGILFRSRLVMYLLMATTYLAGNVSRGPPNNSYETCHKYFCLLRVQFICACNILLQHP